MKKQTESLIRLAPMIQTDIDLVREMNSSQRELHRPFDMWPEWAKHDAQLAANYREHCVASALLNPKPTGAERPV